MTVGFHWKIDGKHRYINKTPLYESVSALTNQWRIMNDQREQLLNGSCVSLRIRCKTIKSNDKHIMKVDFQLEVNGKQQTTVKRTCLGCVHVCVEKTTR